jgi:hypothetical protein
MMQQPNPGIGGWQPPPQQQQMQQGGSYQGGGQQGWGGQQQQWDPANAHSSTMGHNDYPSPGEIHLTMKQYVTRMAIMVMIGIIIGGIIMFRLFPIFVRVVQAAADTSSIVTPIFEIELWRYLLGW